MKAIKVIGLLAGGIVAFYIYIMGYVHVELVRKYTPTNFLKGFIQMFIPGNKFYIYIVDEEIDLGKAGGVKTIKLKNPYLGLYSVDIFFDNFRPVLRWGEQEGDGHSFKGKLKVTLYSDKQVFKNITRQNERLAYSGTYIPRHREGFHLTWYGVQGDAPVNDEIYCRVEVLEPDVELQKYGPVRFVISKSSDM